MKRRNVFSRTLAALLLALVAVLAALIVMPARWLAVALPDAWPVAIVDASGSIWKGSALLALGPHGARTTLPDPIVWRAGWNNGARVELTHPWLECRMTLRLHGSGIGVAPCGLRLPADALATLGAPLNTLKPTGQLWLRWPGMQVGATIPAGELVSLNWQNAGSALSQVRPLGHYRANLKGMNNSIDVQLTTVEGPLILQGSGAIAPNGAFHFSGVARSSSSASPQTIAGLQTILSAIGRRSGDDALLQIGKQPPR